MNNDIPGHLEADASTSRPRSLTSTSRTRPWTSPGRILPKGCGVELREGTWKVPPIIDQLCHWGKVARNEKFRVFNMGVGMVVITAPRHTRDVVRTLSRAGARPSLIGRVVRGRGEVRVLPRK